MKKNIHFVPTREEMHETRGAFSWIDIIVIFGNEYLIPRPFRWKREKERTKGGTHQVNAWIFHRWKSSAIPHRATELPLWIFLVFVTASLKVERAIRLVHFAIIRARKKKCISARERARVSNGTECRLQIGIYVSVKRRIIHESRSSGSIAAHNSSLTLCRVLIPVAI